MRNYPRFQFKHFDPLAGQLPDPHAILFVELIHKARKILHGFSSAEIAEAGLAIRHIPQDPRFIDPLIEELKGEAIKTSFNGTELEVIPTTNEVDAVFQNIGNIDLSKYISLDKFGWAQVFAIWALSYGEKIASDDATLQSWPENSPFPKPTSERVSQIIQEYFQEASHAMTLAEVLIKQESLQKTLLSARNRNAAKQRTSKTSAPLKERVLSLYAEKHQNRSNRDAASKIYNELLSLGEISFNHSTNQLAFNNQFALQTDDPQKRFEIWVGQYKRKA